MHRYGTSFCGQMDAPSFALWQANAQHDPSGWLQRLRAHKEAPILASHHEPSAITNPLQHRAHNSLPPGQDEHGIAQTFLPKLLPRHCKRRSQWRDRAPVAESKQTAPTYRACVPKVSYLSSHVSLTHSRTQVACHLVRTEHSIAQTFLPKLLPRHCIRRSQWRDRAPVAESKQTAPTYRALCAESKLFELPCFTHSLTNPSSLPPGQDRALQCSNLLAKVATSAL